VFVLLTVLGAAEQCSVYIPQQCLYQVSSFKHIPVTQYLPTRANAPGVFLSDGCPIHSAGIFKVNASNCYDYQNSEPSACLHGVLGFHVYESGGFRRRVLTGENGYCSWKPNCIEGEVVTILGDSMMRQLFSRLVSLFRGYEQVVDHIAHVHAIYRVCKEGDEYVTFGEPGTMLPTMLPIEMVDKHLTLNPLPCSTAQTTVYHLFSPTFFDQAIYFRALQNSMRLTESFVIGVHYWDMSANVPLYYFAALANLAARVKRIVIVGTPTRRVPLQHEAGLTRLALQKRNSHIKSWVANQRAKGLPIVFLDFDFFANLPAAPLGDTGDNWHYQCLLIPNKLDGLADFQPKKSKNTWQVTWGNTSASFIRMQEDGTCFDDMNRALWMALSDSLCL